MKDLVIVIPAHNEEDIIKTNVEKVISYLKNRDMGVAWKVLVAENGSTDNTLRILEKMTDYHFSYSSLEARSRSQAIIEAWTKTDADYYMFMDADLSTDIKHIPEIVRGLEKGYDIVIASRKLPESEVKRTPLRNFLSGGFHILMGIVFGLKIKDLQCGCKGINKKIRNHLIPQMRYTDEGFLDTELLVVADNKGYKIKEIPVKWEDIRPSKFKTWKSVYLNVLNSYRIKRDIILKKYH